MKNRKFGSIDDAHNYLSGSIIRVKNDPVYVEQVSSRNRKPHLYYTPIPRKVNTDPDSPLGVVNVELASDDVDMNPIPLGFINERHFTKHLSYGVYRVPARQWKIGLTNNNAIITLNGSTVWREANRGILKSRGLFDMVKNNYPSFEDALASIENNKNSSRAFSRKFSINGDGLVRYFQLDDYVGDIQKGSVRLFSDYVFLAEQLEKDLRNAG
jgi:hypothetical protein